MKYTNESEIKKVLGIDTWRNLSRENFTRFAAMMPDMDKEVALKIVEQFPEFTAFALEAVNVMQKAQEAAHADNKQSMAHVHEAFQEVREILKGQLEVEDLPWDQRKYILDLIMDTGRLQDAKDSENKAFVKDIYKIMGAAVVGALLMTVVFVGGKVDFELPGGKSA